MENKGYCETKQFEVITDDDEYLENIGEFDFDLNVNTDNIQYFINDFED